MEGGGGFPSNAEDVVCCVNKGGGAFCGTDLSPGAEDLVNFGGAAFIGAPPGDKLG